MIKLLANNGAIVVCAGGGGVPEVRGRQSRAARGRGRRGQDLTAAARPGHGGDALVGRAAWPPSTTATAPAGRPIHRATPRELRARPFPAGSMGPKVEAACRFVEATGGMAAIGRLEDAEALLDGKDGTIVAPAGRGPVNGDPDGRAT